MLFLFVVVGDIIVVVVVVVVCELLCLCYSNSLDEVVITLQRLFIFLTYNI